MHPAALMHYRRRNRNRRDRTRHGNFAQRKAARALDYFRYGYGWVMRTCIACNGSGRYDGLGAPPCSGCNGKGRCAEPGPKSTANVAELKSAGVL